MISPSLEARCVSRAFGSVLAVKDASLFVEAGQVVALLGQSGSGKSTLLRLFAGLEGVDSGEILSCGDLVSSVRHVTPPEQRGLGMVFQDYALFPHLTALANVTFGLHHLDKATARDVGLDWLSKVGLADRAAAFPHHLSGGEQQRVALARALAPQPRAILMDEPFSGLDPHLRADLQRTMVSTLRQAGVAALIVSHDTEEALAIADQVAIMHHGRIIQIGAPRDVYNAPLSLQAARALGTVWTMPAIGKNGIVKTRVGDFETSHLGPMIVAARPDTTRVKPASDGPFTVTDVRGVGRFVTVTLAAENCLVQARMEAASAPQIGSGANVAVAASDAFLFQETAQP